MVVVGRGKNALARAFGCVAVKYILYVLRPERLPEREPLALRKSGTCESDL
jgi:siroheme synthase (precorrin-2 oxidase/ferrochelatase)